MEKKYIKTATTFYMSDEKTIDECKKLLEYTFSSKKQYASLVEFLFKVNKNDSIRVVGVDGKEKANYPNNSFLAKGVETVKELVNFLSVYLSHPLNVQTIYEMLPSYLKQTWDNVLDNLYVPADCLDDKNKTDYLDFYGSYAEQCSGEWSWFFVISSEAHWRYGACNVFVFIPIFIKHIFLKALRPQYFEPIKVYNSIEMSGLKKANFEADTLADIVLLQSLISSGKLKSTKNKALSVSSLKYVEKMNLHEFYEKGNNSYLTHLRGYLLSGAMCHFFDMYPNITEKTPQKIAITVFANLFKGERVIYVLPFLLPHLSFSGNKFDNWSGLKRLIDYFFAIFVRTDSSAWIDLRDSIKKMYVIEGVHSSVFDLIFLHRYFLPVEITNTLNDNLKVTPGNQVEQLVKPVLNSITFLMASLGLAELIYEDPEEKSDNLFSGARFIRLTPLGRYLFNIDKVYTPPIYDNCKGAFEMDDNRLIFKIVKGKESYASVADTFARHIGGMRYEVTASSFLKKCSDLDSLKAHIKEFENLSTVEQLPTVWTNFFELLKSRCQPLTNEDLFNYKLFRVSENNHQLIKVLVEDPVLKKYVIRAENYLILVEEKHVKAFEKRLLQLGYLL